MGLKKDSCWVNDDKFKPYFCSITKAPNDL
jgi:hypothetical protein